MKRHVCLLALLLLGACSQDDDKTAAPTTGQPTEQPDAGAPDSADNDADASTPVEPAVGTIEEFVELSAPSEGLAFGVDPQGKPALYLGSKSVLLRVAPDRTITEVTTLPGPLGMAVEASGDLVVCGKSEGDAGKSKLPGALWRVKPDGQKNVIVASTDEAPLDLPNMVAVGPGGEIVFSDSRGNRVYLVAPGATTATLLTDAITYPNGVAFSADGARVLVASYDSKRVFALARDAGGSFGAPEVFLTDVEAVDGITPLPAGGYVLVQTNLGPVLRGADGQSTSLAPSLAGDIPANGAFGVGDFGDKWLYVSNVFGKKIKRVYAGQVGARLPVGQ